MFLTSPGYHIDEECWDAKAQYAIGGSNGKSADEINGGLMRLSRYAHDTVNLFMEKGVEPTQEEFKTAFQMIRDGEKPKLSAKKKSRKDNANDDSDHTDIYSSKQDTNSPKQTFNNFSEPQKDRVMKITFWDVYHEYDHSDYKAMKPYIDVADDIKAEAMKKFDDF